MMIDMESAKVYLEKELEEIDIPGDILLSELLETFCIYTEDDYCEWLKDNFKSFFNYGNPDWTWIKGRITNIKNKGFNKENKKTY